MLFGFQTPTTETRYTHLTFFFFFFICQKHNLPLATLYLPWKINIATISHLNYLLGNCVGWSEALTSNQYHSFSFYTSRVNKPSHLPATVINVTICLHVNELSFSQVNAYFHSFIFTGGMSLVEECCRSAKQEGEAFTLGQTAEIISWPSISSELSDNEKRPDT